MVLGGGVAALSWEVVWQLQASLAFGVSALGTAITLAGTMAGITLGSLAAGRWLDGRPIARPLRLYGWCELAIGAAGLAMLPAFRGLETLDARVWSLAPALAPWLHGVGISAVLAPATLAMGATVPVFQLVARRFGVRVSRLYAANTAGAACGVLGLSFALLPALGVARACVVVAAINVAVFALTRVVERGPAEALAAPEPPPAAPGSAALSFGRAQLAVAFTGLVTFGLEVAWFRVMRAAFWSTSSSFAIMLAAVLIPLALGASAVPWLRRRGVAPTTLLAAAGAAIVLATPLVERLDLLVAATGSHAWAFSIWLLAGLAALGPAVALLATVLPWSLEAFPAPAATGRLYAWNALGSVAGSLAAAWWVLPALGFATTSWALGLGVVALAAALGAPSRRFATLGVGAAALALAVLASSSPGIQRPYGAARWKSDRVVAHVDAPDATLSVIERAGGTRVLMIDGFNATDEDPIAGHYMAWMGHLPALLHPKPERGLVICFGTGQTANALRREGPAVDVVDVSPQVFALAPHFASNERVLDDPRVRAIAMDGRAWLRRSDARYDVVTLEPMPPNFSGVNSLYSLEFYEILATRLAPGGVVAQWLPTHLLTPYHAASITRTFLEVFPDAALWFDPVASTGIVLGRREPGEAPLGAAWPGLARGEVARDLPDDAIRSALWLRRDALARFASAGTLVTDDNQLLQFSQLRAGMRGRRSRQMDRANQTLLELEAGRPRFELPQPPRGRR
jgi:spermidine synthase